MEIVQTISRFFQDAYQELRLASWLTRQQMMASTIVVLILTALMAVFVSSVDWVLLKAVSIFLRLG